MGMVLVPAAFFGFLALGMPVGFAIGVSVGPGGNTNGMNTVDS